MRRTTKNVILSKLQKDKFSLLVLQWGYECKNCNKLFQRNSFSTELQFSSRHVSFQWLHPGLQLQNFLHRRHSHKLLAPLQKGRDREIRRNQINKIIWKTATKTEVRWLQICNYNVLQNQTDFFTTSIIPLINDYFKSHLLWHGISQYWQSPQLRYCTDILR